MPNDPTPELSIIVPVFNEAAILSDLFSTLSRQQGILFELILCDGKSTDDTLQLILEESANCSFFVHGVGTPRGRASQMNAGAAIARGSTLLFLHADSRFSDPAALSTAFSNYTTNQREGEILIHAGHCGLRFKRVNPIPSLAYFFYEAKTRLNRADCIRGDQGFMLSSDVFDRMGGFDESLPFLEDIRFAQAVATQGSWQLLPVEIITSARRFETEGLYERQVVNAIISNCAAAGWGEFFTSLSGLYRCHTETGKLQLFPFLDGIRNLLGKQSPEWRQSFWRTTGSYISGNTWQLFFWLDVRRAFRNDRQPGEVEPHRLDIYQRHLEPLFQSRFAAWLAQQAVRLWFQWMLLKK